jgi:hypothetical protein
MHCRSGFVHKTIMQQIEEIKRHKNKPEQRFFCDLALREPGHIVLVYHAESAGRIADIDIAPGSTTIAHYWQSGGYVLWRMFAADRTLIGTLFHICTNTDIHETSVSYDDLILDIWITPQGIARVLDEDELSDAIKAGWATDDEQRWIEQQKQIILADYANIIGRICDIETAFLNPEGTGMPVPC